MTDDIAKPRCDGGGLAAMFKFDMLFAKSSKFSLRWNSFLGGSRNRVTCPNLFAKRQNATPSSKSAQKFAEVSERIAKPVKKKKEC